MPASSWRRSISARIGQLSGVIAFAALGLLGQYAVYRARRYRLTRTIYRGLRFHQSGSAWALCLARGAVVDGERAHVRAGLSVPARQPGTLQDAQHLLRRPRRPFRRLGLSPAAARLADVARGGRAARARRRRLHRGGRLESARRCAERRRRRRHEPHRGRQSGARRRHRVRHADGGHRRHAGRPALSGVPGADACAGGRRDFASASCR